MNVVVVDSSAERKNYLDGVTAYQPHEVIEKIKQAGLLVINTKVHAEDILRSVHEKTGRQFKNNEVIIVDDF